jgi:hypothetical protein
MTANSEMWKSLLIKILLMILTPLAVQLHIQSGVVNLPAIAADIADLLLAAFSVYRSSGMKLAPHSGIVVSPISSDGTGSNVITAGDHINFKTVGGANITAKVVGALLIGFLLFAGDAKAAALTKTQATQNPIAVIQNFTVTDLQAALDDATANNDIAAISCYTALIPIVQSGITNPLPKGVGAFQLLQKARDLKAIAANLQSPNGPLAKLNIACAPLLIDAQNTLIQLGVLGGSILK